MNQKINYDAEFCGKVPLHQTNLIQPHGVLVILNREDLKIIQVSENATDVFGMTAKDLVNKTFDVLIPAEQLAKLKEKISRTKKGKLPVTLTYAAGNHLSIVFAHESYLILEIERQKRSAATDETFIAVYEELKFAMAAVEDAANTEETCSIAIRELKKISGFDKIMVYKFDESWNGDVIAEEKEEGMDTYLGLKFPASDVPKQARELYKKNPYRLIPNVDYEPVRLYPVINPVTGAFTDLSDSNLRSVAGVHLEYLKNMKVTASMSTRILVDGELWGLISCHHRSAKYLSFEMCSVFEILSNVISAKIGSVQKQDAFSYRNGMQSVYTDLIEEIYRDQNLFLSLSNRQADLLDLLKAEGVTVVMDNSIEKFGLVPSDEEVEALVLWLQARKSKAVYHQNSLGTVYEPAEKFAGVGSGLLALPIQPEKGNYILAFRPEAVRNVNWGGNPNEAIQFEPDQKNYHPRNSFKLWQQRVQHTAVPWNVQELEVAEQFRNFVVEYTLNRIYN